MEKENINAAIHPKTGTDMYGEELKKGDNICFTISLRKDQKPLVKAVIAGFGKDARNDWVIIGSYVDSPSVRQAESEKKLPAKVSSGRVIKCY